MQTFALTVFTDFLLAEEAEKAEGESGDTDDDKSKGDEEEQ